MKVGTNNLVGGGRRVGDPAGDLTGVERSIAPFVERENIIFATTDCVRHKTENGSGFVAVLGFTFREINAFGKESAWRSGLESSNFKAEFA